MVLGTDARQRREGRIDTIDLGLTVIKTSTCVKSLGVLIDDTLSFRDHVNSVCKGMGYHLRALSHIRNCIPDDVAKSIAVAAISSRLDYCNSLLYLTSKGNIHKLQMIQNSAARVVTRSKRFHSITPILKDLHWLPVSYRITYKIALLTFKIITTGQPVYLRELIRPQEPVLYLRSANTPADRW